MLLLPRMPYTDLMPIDCCSVKDCGKDIFCSSLCSKHYSRLRRYGDTQTVKKVQKWSVPCSVQNCGRKVKGHGYCGLHYQRFKKFGDPMITSIPPPRRAARTYIEHGIAYVELTKGAYAKVDPDDLPKVSGACWQLNAYGYATRIIEKPKRHGITMHHVIIGKPPKGFVTDHLNRDRTDNRKHNLRHVSPADNTRNSSVMLCVLPL